MVKIQATISPSNVYNKETTWSKVAGASGYEVHVRRPGSSNYTYVARVDKTNKYTYSYSTWFGKESGKYFFKIVPFKEFIDLNAKYKGAMSPAKSITIK